MSGDPQLSVHILNWDTKNLMESSVHVHHSSQLWTSKLSDWCILLGTIQWIDLQDISLGLIILFRISSNLTSEGYKPGY